MSKRTGKESHAKERGCWLTGYVIFIMIHGIVASVLVWYLAQSPQVPKFPWTLPALFLLSLADIVAGIGIWNWKKWGLWLYAISVAVGIAVGLVLTGTQLVVFYEVIFLAFLGYLVKDKMQLFA
jgi:hypothetical protein